MAQCSTFFSKSSIGEKHLILSCLILLYILAGCGGGGSGSPPPPPPTPSNPTPSIVSLAPASANAGDPSFTLTVAGYNFSSSSTAQWNGSARITTYTSDTQLLMQVSASDVASSGTALISVVTPSPGGGNSGPAQFVIRASSYPTPSLTGLTPTSADSGSSGFILTLYGHNFVPESIIE